MRSWGFLHASGSQVKDSQASMLGACTSVARKRKWCHGGSPYIVKQSIVLKFSLSIACRLLGILARYMTFSGARKTLSAFNIVEMRLEVVMAFVPLRLTLTDSHVTFQRSQHFEASASTVLTL